MKMMGEATHQRFCKIDGDPEVRGAVAAGTGAVQHMQHHGDEIQQLRDRKHSEPSSSAKCPEPERSGPNSNPTRSKPSSSASNPEPNANAFQTFLTVS